MNHATRRLRRWAFRGALILAAIAIVLGQFFTIVITMAVAQLPSDSAGWISLIIRTAVLWGVGGLFFGSILGMYASLIWRDPASLEQDG